MGEIRFRLLTNTELESLSEEFIQFLVVQGIDDQMWRDINTKTPEKANDLVSVFSDTVLKKVYSKVKFMSFVSEQVFSIFKIEAHTMHVVVIKNLSIDLGFKDIEDVITRLKKDLNDCEAFTATRELGSGILDEIHSLTEKGCLIAEQDLWKQFEHYQKKTSN